MSTKTPKPTASPRILDAAVALAKEKGIRGFSRAEVATLAKVAPATVSFHFADMNSLRQQVAKRAMQDEILPILADLRADRRNNDLYTRMSADLKQKVAAYMAN